MTRSHILVSFRVHFVYKNSVGKVLCLKSYAIDCF